MLTSTKVLNFNIINESLTLLCLASDRNQISPLVDAVCSGLLPVFFVTA